jgi:hypothetical protein
VPTPASAVHLGRFSIADTARKLLKNFGNFAINTIRCTVIPFVFMTMNDTSKVALVEPKAH